ncbi:MAG: anthranilate synthase component I, partial [Thermodesulfobacteriota bacterium]
MSSINCQPAYQDFEKSAESSCLVPVYCTIISDLDTPLTLFAKIGAEESHSFLFESMEGGEKWGRYSFIGIDPLLTFASKEEVIDVESFKGDLSERVKLSGDPLETLKKILEDFKAAENDALPRFCGGAVGFLGYDMVRFMEELPDERQKLDFPDSSFMIPRIVLVHDSFKQSVTVVCW